MLMVLLRRYGFLNEFALTPCDTAGGIAVLVLDFKYAQLPVCGAPRCTCPGLH